jgi:hypothetical protein
MDFDNFILDFKYLEQINLSMETTEDLREFKEKLEKSFVDSAGTYAKTFF